MLQISLIIPTYNESVNIENLIRALRKNSDKRLLEIIVVDGQSQDDTLECALRGGADRAFTSPKKGRAYQMNYGAMQAKGEILYFVHADTIPPESYLDDIEDSLKNNYEMGCYRYVFDSDMPILKINAYCTRFDRLMCRGGDQTFFIPKKLFEKLGGYNERYCIMEEYEFLRRARKVANFRIIPKDAVVSARKYDNNSYLRVNFANLVVFMMFFMGFSPTKMASTYKYLLDYR